jgi:hypothetical protein
MRPPRRHDGRSAAGGDAAAVFGLDRHSLGILAVLVSEHKFRLQIQQLPRTYDKNARRNAPRFPNLSRTNANPLMAIEPTAVQIVLRFQP